MKQRKQLTETELIQKFTRSIETAGVHPGGLVLGVGDDAAVFNGPRGEDFVVTQDVQVEGRHFYRKWFSGRELGWRLAAVNLSDIAAMGAAPRYALFSLVLPRDLETTYVDHIARGIVAQLAQYGAALIGGNVATTDGPLTCDLTLIGSCRRGRAWRRRALAGDAIVLVGAVGEASAGLELLRSGGYKTRGNEARLVRAFKSPQPLLDVAKLISSVNSVHGAIDVSDGLSTDLRRVCRASGLGCEVKAESLPLSRALSGFCAGKGITTYDWMLRGGEDYALILCVAARAARRLCDRIENETGRSAKIIGRFTENQDTCLLRENGSRSRLLESGWDHLTAPD